MQPSVTLPSPPQRRNKRKNGKVFFFFNDCILYGAAAAHLLERGIRRLKGWRRFESQLSMCQSVLGQDRGP